MNKDPVPQADQLYLLGKKQISLQASTVLDEVGAKAGDRDINSVTVTTGSGERRYSHTSHNLLDYILSNEGRPAN